VRTREAPFARATVIKYLSKHRKPIFIAIVAIFLIGIFVGLGGYLFSSADTREAVAEVGGTKIPYSLFLLQANHTVDRMREQGTEVTDDLQKRVKQEVLQEMVVEELLAQKASELGLVVTDLELASEIHHNPAFQRAGAFDQRAYFEGIRYLFHMTPRQYEDMRRKSLMALKLRQFVFLAAKLTPVEIIQAYQAHNGSSMKDFEKKKAEFANSLQQERALHLLNFYLRSLSTRVEIRSYLEQREKGTP
jgi:hypothetical protein